MSNSSQKLAGKITLVTGGNGGIGLATAKRFAAEGAAKVFVTGRRQAELDAAVQEIGSVAVGVLGDVAIVADVDRLYAAVKEQAGRLDVVFANAGFAEFAPLGEITEDHYDRQFDTNVKGLLFAVQKALPLMGKGGSIILNASVVASKGTPGMSVYSATKGAVRNFARSWTLDLKDRGIRVNVVSPGPIHTPGLDKAASEEFKQQIVGMVPMGRIGDADEVARAAVFLASDDSTFTTGAELFVDGGMAQV